jgi:hypothetical protein
MESQKSQFIQIAGRSKDNHIIWEMRCVCGNTYTAYATRIRQNLCKQCKKCRNKQISDSKKTHGMRLTTEYSSYKAMKSRCLTPTNKDYERYGAKNITICKEWIESFDNFYRDLGKKPKGYSLDRIDNTKGYFPENCRWASKSTQQRNKRNSCVWLIKEIEFLSLKEAASFFNLTTTTISKWVYGYFDKRRNKFTEPRNDCKKIHKY